MPRVKVDCTGCECLVEWKLPNKVYYICKRLLRDGPTADKLGILQKYLPFCRSIVTRIEQKGW